jgi:hypothetical protein
MMYYIQGADVQEYFREGQSYTLNGVQSVAGPGCLGGVAVVFDPPQHPNEKFYAVVERFEGSVCHLDITPRPTDDVKSEMIEWVKYIAGNLLAASDWKVVRAAEGVKPCDNATLTYRDSIRAESDRYEAAVNDCTTVEELAELPAPSWPQVL